MKKGYPSTDGADNVLLADNVLYWRTLDAHAQDWIKYVKQNTDWEASWARKRGRGEREKIVRPEQAKVALINARVFSYKNGWREPSTTCALLKFPSEDCMRKARKAMRTHFDLVRKKVKTSGSAELTELEREISDNDFRVEELTRTYYWPCVPPPPTHSCTHAPTHPRTHAPTHPRTHAPPLWNTMCVSVCPCVRVSACVRAHFRCGAPCACPVWSTMCVSVCPRVSARARA